MRTHRNLLRGGLVALLIGSAILFLIGSTIERNHRHHDSPAATSTEVSGGETAKSGESGETGETGGESSKPIETHAEASHGEAGAKILGINPESLALSIVAVVLSVLLAFAVWLGRWSRLVLLAVIGFGLVFAAGDARELVHQLDESNNGLATVAAILIVLHLGVAALAAALLWSRPRAAVAANEAA
jgi:hypothetical protein